MHEAISETWYGLNGRGMIELVIQTDLGFIISGKTNLDIIALYKRDMITVNRGGL